MEVILGKFKMTSVKCGVNPCTFSGNRRFRKPEEKRTDVNIAVQMLDDAYQDQFYRLVLVSGDSDLAPAVDLVKMRFPGKRANAYVPSRFKSRGAAVELRSVADQSKTLPLAILKRAQFPRRIPDGRGGFIEKPSDW